MTKLAHIVCLLVLLGITEQLNAQHQKVVLKNKSIVRGSIERFENNTLFIRVDSAAILTIPTHSISSIFIKNKDRMSLSNEIVKGIEIINGQETKGQFYHQVRFGILNGEDGNFQRGFSNLSMDYAFFRKSRGSLHAGVGLALDYYTSFVALPLFFELRKDLSPLPSHPFIYGKLGYARAGYRQDFNGNFGNVFGREMWALGAGYEWPLGNADLLISVGFRKQNLQSVWESFDFRQETSWQLNRLDFKIGLRL